MGRGLRKAWRKGMIETKIEANFHCSCITPDQIVLTKTHTTWTPEEVRVL